MLEQEVKSEMRLWALEVLVCNLLVMVLSADPKPIDVLEKIFQQMVQGAKQRTFSDLNDAALSDLFSAELQAAVERLRDMGKTQMILGIPASKLPSKPPE